MNNYIKDSLVNSGKPPSFDDVLLVPAYTEVESRLSPTVSTTVGRGLNLDAPIISSPMDTVTGPDMALSLGSNGGMGILHRFCTLDEQLSYIRRLVVHNELCGLNQAATVPISPAIGIGRDGKDRMKAIFNEFGGQISSVAIDVANGHSSYMRDMIRWVKDLSQGELHVIAGNVATGDGFAFLSDAGADAVRVGIGGGSICKTRIMTGVGVPTLASVIDSYSVKNTDERFSETAIIADGGIRYPADLVKSLAAGADAIMAGRVFAGTLESPGHVIQDIDGNKMKVYRGMASKEVQEDKRGGLRPGTCAEGVSTYIPLKGKAHYIVDEFCGGLRSAMTYLNSLTIEDLRDNARFIRLTASSIEESHAFGTKK